MSARTQHVFRSTCTVVQHNTTILDSQYNRQLNHHDRPLFFFWSNGPSGSEAGVHTTYAPPYLVPPSRSNARTPWTERILDWLRTLAWRSAFPKIPRTLEIILGKPRRRLGLLAGAQMTKQSHLDSMYSWRWALGRPLSTTLDPKPILRTLHTATTGRVGPEHPRTSRTPRFQPHLPRPWPPQMRGQRPARRSRSTGNEPSLGNSIPPPPRPK